MNLVRLPTYTLFPYTTLFRSMQMEPLCEIIPTLPGSCAGSRSAWMYTMLRSEEHTSELQSQFQLVCRLLLEKKKQRATDSAYSCRTQYHDALLLYISADRTCA